MERKTHTIITHSEEDTIAFAGQLVEVLRADDVVLLNGNLGMGKSVLSRALVRALCGTPEMEVPSPTFTLVQSYDARDCEVWHMDLYRLSEPDEIYELGWEDALGQNLLLIEWPERLSYLTPKSYVQIDITAPTKEPNTRQIKVSFV